MKTNETRRILNLGCLFILITLLMPSTTLARQPKPPELAANDIVVPRAAETGPGISLNPQSTPTANAKNVEFVGHIGGRTDAVAVQENYAYVGEGLRLIILDISDPTIPTLVGKTPPLPDVIRDIAVDGDVAYVAAGSDGLRIVDVSNPATPIEVGFYDIPQIAQGVALAGNMAYVAAGSAGLWVIDVSDPTNPTEISDCDTLEYARNVTLHGDLAYVVGYDGLGIIDVSNSESLMDVDFYDVPRNARDVAVAGNYAYIAGGNYDKGGLRIVDVSNPSAPVEVGFYDTPGYASGVVVNGNMAYIADGASGLRVVDISNPAAPVEVGFYDIPKYTNNLVVIGDLAYITDFNDGLRVIDVSDPLTLVEVGFYNTPGEALSAAVLENDAYIVGSKKLWVVDASNPVAPVVISECDIMPEEGWGLRSIALSGNYAYVGADDLWIIDMSDLTVPAVIGFLDMRGDVKDIAVAGNYAYVATELEGVEVVDVSNPAAPVTVGTEDKPAGVAFGVAFGVTVSRDYAYVALAGSREGYIMNRDKRLGLRVVDVSNPIAPAEVGFYETPGNAYDVVVKDGLAYVGDEAGLRVIDVSDPTAPVEVGFYETGGAMDIELVGVTMYIVNVNYSLLSILDVSDPTTPVPIDAYHTSGHALSVAATEDGMVYVSGMSGGLLILRYTGDESDASQAETPATKTAIPTIPATETPESPLPDDQESQENEPDPSPDTHTSTPEFPMRIVGLVTVLIGFASVGSAITAFLTSRYPPSVKRRIWIGYGVLVLLIAFFVIVVIL